MKEKVAIQGAQGSNHHMVVDALFGKKAKLIECMSFSSLVDAVLDESATVGVMAIENTIAGSIIPNYALVDENNLHITGEYYLHIHHHLMALKGQTIHDICEVWSHPMALLQCKTFFKQYPNIKLVEEVDTALMAKKISENQLKGIAAIAPKMAADLFELAVIADDIQTISNNATRFVILSKHKPALKSGEVNKASFKFQLNHKRGSLATLLNVLSDCKMNLTKIQSLPVIEMPWKYSFFVDVTFQDFADYTKAVSLIEIMAEDFKILGAYKNGRE